MSEAQGVDGDIWLNKAIEILTALGWSQHGSPNVDIDIPWEDHEKGIDAYFTYYDPFDSANIGIFIEAKMYKWDNITPSFLKKTVNKMVSVIQEAPSAEDFNKKLNFNIASITNTGLIMIWSHDKFDEDTFVKYLENLEIPKKVSLQRIFIASNHEILKFCSMIETCKDIKKRFNLNNGIKFYYPSLSTKKNAPLHLNNLTLEYMYSEYVFIKADKIENVGKYPVPKKILVVMNFEGVTLESLNLMYDSLIEYQLLDVDEVWVYLYEGNEKANREPLDEFKRRIEAKKNDNDANELINKCIEFNFNPMIHIDDVFSWGKLR